MEIKTKLIMYLDVRVIFCKPFKYKEGVVYFIY